MKAFQRILTLLLALVMVICLIPGTFAAEDEEGTDGEYEGTDAYIYHHDVANNGYTGPKFQYFSPYYATHYYDGEPRGYNTIFIYTIYNSVTGKVIPTYCTDIFTGAYSENRYRRLNLEDSAYAASSGPLLRAIMLEGFYLVPDDTETMEEHNARAYAKLAELGAIVGVPDLTIGEAIAGTQLAIWRAAHGPLLEYNPLIRNVYTYTNLQPTLFKYYDICNVERENGHYTLSYGSITQASKDYVMPRIQAVIDYLLALTPVEATEKVVSTASFKVLKESAPTMNDDGTYNLHLYVTVDVDMKEGDHLTLTAMADTNHYAKAELVDGEQKITLHIPNVPADIAFNEVTLAIDGVQTYSDVILFEAENGYEKSQSMLGIDDSQIPAHAMLTTKPKRDPIRVEKDVITLGNDSSSEDAYNDHLWIVGTNVPDDMATAKSFVIYDSLDNRLDYTGNLEVKLEDVNGNELLTTLVENEDYDLILVDGDSTVGEADAFRISLTLAGINKIVAALGDRAYADYMLRVYFTAQINYNANVAEEIPNQATAEYVNGNDLKYTAKSDIPVVYTGGANLLKVDAIDQTKTLAGATFKVFRNATEREVANNVAGLTYIDGVVPPVVPVSFFDNKDLTGEKITEITSGEDGKIAIYGLAYGTYYLVEKESPTGYNRMKDYLVMDITATSHLEANTIIVENTNGSTLPGTGGIGTALFTAVGVIMIGFAVILLVIRRRMATYES